LEKPCHIMVRRRRSIEKIQQRVPKMKAQKPGSQLYGRALARRREGDEQGGGEARVCDRNRERQGAVLEKLGGQERPGAKKKKKKKKQRQTDCFLCQP